MEIKLKQGFIKYKKVGKAKHNLFELERIEVYPEYIRKGCGRELFKRMEEKIGTYRKLFCLTHASNKVAHRFYEAMGMKLESVIPNHYYQNESEFIYAKYITD